MCVPPQLFFLAYLTCSHLFTCNLFFDYIFDRYLLDYEELFGGAIAITRDQFTLVNGFSNQYFGWGGEDDDLYRRLSSNGIEIIRLSPTVSSYRMLPHEVIH